MADCNLPSASRQESVAVSATAPADVPLGSAPKEIRGVPARLREGALSTLR